MLKHMIKCGTLNSGLLENATAEPGRGMSSGLSSAAAFCVILDTFLTSLSIHSQVHKMGERELS